MFKAAFVDKAGGRGHNEKASLELESRLGWGFTHSTRARVAELADALASGASDRKVVEVRVLSRAPSNPSVFGQFRFLLHLESAYRIQERRSPGWNQRKD
jgi:hypothetical protein